MCHITDEYKAQWKSRSHCSLTVSCQRLQIYHQQFYFGKRFALIFLLGNTITLRGILPCFYLLAWATLMCFRSIRLYTCNFYCDLGYNVMVTVLQLQQTFWWMEVSCPTEVLSSGGRYTSHCHVTQPKFVQSTNITSASNISCNFFFYENEMLYIVARMHGLFLLSWNIYDVETGINFPTGKL
jgi:hypothetical protein